ncbi:MAG: MarR family transcriptional regulator [Acetatifactor sp.]|jgi:DNA-binding MarR family transcriptional regulator|nr:MarR family transcriptional regulator [Acetatifactor sp.]
MEERHIGLELKAIEHAIRRSLDMRFSRNGLEDLFGIQGPIIGFLYDHREDSVFQKDIEKAFNIRRSSATVLLQTLEQKGFIIRESIKQDGRMKKIILTDKAVESNLHIRRELEAFDEMLERNITPEEKETFLHVLDKIRDNLQQEDEK